MRKIILSVVSTLILSLATTFGGITDTTNTAFVSNATNVTQCVTSNRSVTASDPRGTRRFSKKMKLMKYNEQKGICPHCKKRFKFDQMQGDHIIPYSKGGCTVYENLQMLCAPCNHKKGNRYSY